MQAYKALSLKGSSYLLDVTHPTFTWCYCACSFLASFLPLCMNSSRRRAYVSIELWFQPFIVAPLFYLLLENERCRQTARRTVLEVNGFARSRLMGTTPWGACANVQKVTWAFLTYIAPWYFKGHQSAQIIWGSSTPNPLIHLQFILCKLVRTLKLNLRSGVTIISSNSAVSE